MDGIILLAKRSGCTSFSSLWQIKHALSTKKIGHTGTLDSFADGLLVALSGGYTHLVSYITDCDKEYIARITFGFQTDTLDPCGTTVETAALPLKNDFLTSVSRFIGPLDQIPPAYSAIHINGQRSSDRIRRGEDIKLPSRPIVIFELEVLNLESTWDERGREVLSSADIRVLCSKGTYIRSLARDIACSVSSLATVTSLRRTKIGPFSLSEAAGFTSLPDFGCPYEGKVDVAQEILAGVKEFTPALSGLVGIQSVQINPLNTLAFINGQPPVTEWFFFPDNAGNGVFSVFCESSFIGMVTKQGAALGYEFVYRGNR